MTLLKRMMSCRRTMNSRVLHNVYKLKKLIDRKIKNMADIRSRANCNSIFMGKEL